MEISKRTLKIITVVSSILLLIELLRVFIMPFLPMWGFVVCFKGRSSTFINGALSLILSSEFWSLLKIIIYIFIIVKSLKGWQKA